MGTFHGLYLASLGVSATTLGVSWRGLGRSLVVGTAICVADFWIGSRILGEDFAPWDVLLAACWRAVTQWPLDLSVAIISIGVGVLSEELLRVTVVLGVQSATGVRWLGVLASFVLYLLTHRTRKLQHRVLGDDRRSDALSGRSRGSCSRLSPVQKFSAERLRRLFRALGVRGEIQIDLRRRDARHAAGRRSTVEHALVPKQEQPHIFSVVAYDVVVAELVLLRPDIEQ